MADLRIGNKFWELRSKHGREKLFVTPELMWEAACEYFDWCQNNPINDPRSYGGIAMIPRPFTIHGLCSYLCCNTQYFKTFKAQLPEGEKDFNTVVRNIEERIYQQKFEHAVIGIFKENIIARDLGLTEKSQVDNNIKIQPVVIDWIDKENE